jgi:hypothetical protein
VFSCVIPYNFRQYYEFPPCRSCRISSSSWRTPSLYYRPESFWKARPDKTPTTPPVVILLTDKTRRKSTWYRQGTSQRTIGSRPWCLVSCFCILLSLGCSLSPSSIERCGWSSYRRSRHAILGCFRLGFEIGSC